MSYSIDKSYFDQLLQMKPDELSKRCNCKYASKTKSYIFEMWNERYAIKPEGEKIQNIDDGSIINNTFGLVLIYYLLHAKKIFPKNEWISEKDIPGGSSFFVGPHAIPTYLIINKFEDNIEGLNNACRLLKGNKLDMADLAYSFSFTDRIPVALLFWKGDEEFPAEAKILFDRTIYDHFSPDIIFLLSLEICERIVKVSS